MYRSFLKATLPVIALVSLGACQNYFVKPSIIPTGYAFQNDKYKTIPSARPVNLGYEYSREQNDQILKSMRVKIAELLDQMEKRNEIENQTVFVFTPHDHNAQNAAFDHILRDELRARNFTLTQDELEGLRIGYSISEPEHLERDVNFGDLNSDHRDNPHYKRIHDYEQMIVEIALMDGPETLDVVRGVYAMPMFGYERDNQIDLRVPIVGRQFDRFDDDKMNK